MSLHNLVDNGQTQSGSTLELGLKGLKYFFCQLRAHAGAAVRKIDLPILTDRFDRNCKDSAIFHRTSGVLTKIPKYLLDLVSVGKSSGFFHTVAALDANARVFRNKTVLQQGEGVFH